MHPLLARGRASPRATDREGAQRLTTAELLAIVLRTGSRDGALWTRRRFTSATWTAWPAWRPPIPRPSPSDRRGAGEDRADQGRSGAGPAAPRRGGTGCPPADRLLAGRPGALCAALTGLQHEQCDILFLNGGNDVVALGDSERGVPSPRARYTFATSWNAPTAITRPPPSWSTTTVGPLQPSAGDRA